MDSDDRQFLAVSCPISFNDVHRTSEGDQRVAFQFDLRECEKFSIISDLPPSLDSREEGRRLSTLRKNDANDYAISYSITATVLDKRDTIVSTTQQISILPVHAEQPPCFSGFPGELHWATPQHARSFHQKYRDIQIELAAQEPGMFVLNPCSRALDASIKVSFVAKCSLPAPDPQALHKSLPEPPRRCSLKAHLVTKTILTPNGNGMEKAEGRPSTEHPRFLGKYENRIHRSHQQENTLDLSHWDHFESSKCILKLTSCACLIKSSYRRTVLAYHVLAYHVLAPFQH